jgi:RNA polymerase sigma factor (sigma-70 family)
MQDEETLIKNLKENSTIALQHLYTNYREGFIKWAAFNYNIDKEEAEDVCSDTCIDVYHNIINERYKKTSESSLKSYFYEIGKYKILNIISRGKMTDNHHKIIAERSKESVFMSDAGHHKKEMVEKVKELMDLMDDKCQKVLTLFYFHNLSMELIAEKMDFKNEDVAKNKKLKCLRRLQILTLERYEKTDFF